MLFSLETVRLELEILVIFLLIDLQIEIDQGPWQSTIRARFPSAGNLRGVGMEARGARRLSYYVRTIRGRKAVGFSSTS